jgi:zinc-ribbon domain
MASCSSCGARIEAEFRFCPGCGQALRTKIVEYFRGDRRLDDGDLRVSVYLAEPRHVRFSVWRNETAEAAMSLDPPEAARLARFLATAVEARGGGSLLRKLRLVR